MMGFTAERKKSTKPTAPEPPIVESWQENAAICPPGLQWLMPLDRIFIDRNPEGIEVIRSWHTEKSYKIMDNAGQHLYTALEESMACGRCCLGVCHAWKFHIIDKNNREAFQVIRPCRSSSCCCPCFLQRLKVKVDGKTIGRISQNWNAWRPSFKILDGNKTEVLNIKGPIFLNCSSEVEFEIYSLIDRQRRIGVVTKKWSGLAREYFQDGNSFAICFPLDLDVKIKAVLLGASILMDFVYFEEHTNIKRMTTDS